MTTSRELPTITFEQMEQTIFNSIHLDQEIKIGEEKYTVYKFYPNFVLTKNKRGFNECFTYPEIYINLFGI